MPLSTCLPTKSSSHWMRSLWLLVALIPLWFFLCHIQPPHSQSIHHSSSPSTTCALHEASQLYPPRLDRVNHLFPSFSQICHPFWITLSQPHQISVLPSQPMQFCLPPSCPGLVHSPQSSLLCRKNGFLCPAIKMVMSCLTQRLKYPEGISELGNFEPPKTALSQSKQKVSSKVLCPKEYFQCYKNLASC